MSVEYFKTDIRDLKGIQIYPSDASNYQKDI